MARARRITWKAKGGDGTHITIGMIGGITISCAAFICYMYHYHVRPPVVVMTSGQIQPSQLPKDTSSLYIGGVMPVNQPTRGELVDYQHLGILHP
jgi:hypothetical protein